MPLRRASGLATPVAVLTVAGILALTALLSLEQRQRRVQHMQETLTQLQQQTASMDARVARMRERLSKPLSEQPLWVCQDGVASCDADFGAMFEALAQRTNNRLMSWQPATPGQMQSERLAKSADGNTVEARRYTLTLRGIYGNLVRFLESVAQTPEALEIEHMHLWRDASASAANFGLSDERPVQLRVTLIAYRLEAPVSPDVAE